MKRVAVLGGNGFIGHHLVNYLKDKGYWVRSVDIKKLEFSKQRANEERLLDLTERFECLLATQDVDEVYQLAAQMGGMGFISKEHLLAFHDSNLINTYVPFACVKNKVERLFFSSSVCVYPVDKINKGEIMTEEDISPANPNEAYGWEKLMAELRYLSYQETKGLKIRIARFDNTYGPEGTYDGGREKAPAALCRKVALADKEIEVWGNGKATRHFLYVDDLVDGIYKLMQSDYNKPVNLGTDELVTINQLAGMIIKISGKELKIKNIDGPVGAIKRRISHTKAKRELNWKAKTSLMKGIEKTYKWIEERLNER